MLILAGAGLAALSALPGASAARVCSKPEGSTEEICRDTLPKQAKIAIALVVVTLLFLTLTLLFFLRRSRLRSSASADLSSTLEASQVTGPATVLRATYNPGSGHSIYTHGVGASAGNFAIGSAGDPFSAGIPGTAVIPPTASPAPSMVQMPVPVLPSMPAPPIPSTLPSKSGVETPSQVSVPKTAPAHRSTFSNGHVYPFSSNGNAISSGNNPPKSALPLSFRTPSGGGSFPRPLLAGRLKDRIRERPPSASSLVQEFAGSSSSSGAGGSQK